jgi:uncharacterized protein (TIGR02118 family)
MVMYRTPTDAAAFDDHYQRVHVPLAKKIPGVRRFEVNDGPIGTPAGPAAFHLIASLSFDDLAALQAAMVSPEGQAAAADVASFATGGVEMLIYETREG